MVRLTLTPDILERYFGENLRIDVQLREGI